MEKRILYLVVFVVIIAVAALAYTTFFSQKSASGLNGQIGMQVPQSFLSRMNVPSSVSNKIGAGAVSNPPFKVNSSVLYNGTKPMIVYIGADYCPYCAITRWGLIVALQRFGNFSNLHYMASSPTDVYPSTPTFSFYNATYSSNYVSFEAVETTSRNNSQTLQVPTDFQNLLISTYDPRGGIPFVDFANLSIQNGAPTTPEVLQGYNWNETVANLTDVNSSMSETIVGMADVYTAEICRATNMTPQNVCSQPYVAKLLKTLA